MIEFLRRSKRLHSNICLVSSPFRNEDLLLIIGRESVVVCFYLTILLLLMARVRSHSPFVASIVVGFPLCLLLLFALSASK